jgi:hypothetical protein
MAYAPSYQSRVLFAAFAALGAFVEVDFGVTVGVGGVNTAVD